MFGHRKNEPRIPCGNLIFRAVIRLTRSLNQTYECDLISYIVESMTY